LRASPAPQEDEGADATDGSSPPRATGEATGPRAGASGASERGEEDASAEAIGVWHQPTTTAARCGGAPGTAPPESSPDSINRFVVLRLEYMSQRELKVTAQAV
jgi:hypothetical protein